MKKSKAAAASASAAAAARQPSHAAQNGHVLPSKLARYLDPEASWDKDQLLDAVHWIRQAVGLACGLLWGAVPLVGAFWIALSVPSLPPSSNLKSSDPLSRIYQLRDPFFTISTVIVHLYYAYLLKIDEEDFGGHAALLQEGLFASFTLFLLSWTLVYSLVHF
ncbi:hypothetical protein ACQ4PT_046756 [Festuca glaucescens]